MLRSTVKNTPTLHLQRPKAEKEAPTDNAHIAFAIVFLGTAAMFVGSILWLVLR